MADRKRSADEPDKQNDSATKVDGDGAAQAQSRQQSFWLPKGLDGQGCADPE